MRVARAHGQPVTAVSSGLGPQGWIPVEPRILRMKAGGVWAIGDVAAVPLVDGLFLPQAGVSAEGAAPAVADDVARHLGHQAPEPLFPGQGGG